MECHIYDFPPPPPPILSQRLSHKHKSPGAGALIELLPNTGSRLAVLGNPWVNTFDSENMLSFDLEFAT